MKKNLLGPEGVRGGYGKRPPPIPPTSSITRVCKRQPIETTQILWALLRYILLRASRCLFPWRTSTEVWEWYLLAGFSWPTPKCRSVRPREWLHLQARARRTGVTESSWYVEANAVVKASTYRHSQDYEINGFLRKQYNYCYHHYPTNCVHAWRSVSNMLPSASNKEHG